MREIKFKAWHKAESKMCTVETLRPNIGAFLIGALACENQLVEFANKAYEVIAPENGRFCDICEFELMQYTGIKDEKGREIYEDDIIKMARIETGEEYFIGKVTFSGIYGITIDSKNDYMDFDLKKFTYEIIGNIYENASLLTT